MASISHWKSWPGRDSPQVFREKKVGIDSKSLNKSSLTSAKVGKFVVDVFIILSIAALLIGILAIAHKIAVPILATYILLGGGGSVALMGAGALHVMKRRFPDLYLSPEQIERKNAPKLSLIDRQVTEYLDSLGLRVQKPLGSGGFGQVFLYKATKDLDLGSQKIPKGAELAIKLFFDQKQSELLEKYNFAYLNRGEAILLENDNQSFIKSHAIIVKEGGELRLIHQKKQLLDVDWFERRPPIQQLKATIMEYFNGVNVIDLIAEGRVDPSMLYKIGAQICAALIGLRADGIIHRDLKPENILINLTGDAITVKLCDFGISRQTKEASSPVGTAGYLDTPQVMSQKTYGIDKDLVAFGKILFQLTYLAEAAKQFSKFSQRMNELQRDAKCEEEALKDSDDRKLEELNLKMFQMIEKIEDENLKEIIKGLVNKTMGLEGVEKRLSE